MTNIKNNKFGNWVQRSITARMLMIGFLILILLIPLSFIKSLINERSERQEEVVNEINQKWGNEVLLYGPVLKIPYKEYSTKTIIQNKKSHIEKIEHIKYAYYFPNKLNLKTVINAEKKKRGIYNTSVYKGNLDISGSYSKIVFNKNVSVKDILWEDATIIYKTSNLKGINNQINIILKETSNSFIPKYDNVSLNSKGLSLHTLELETAKTNLNKHDFLNNINFRINLNISGSKQFRIIPIGKETNLTIKSDWKTANFIGNFLPNNSDKISDNGFNAKWKVLHINRPFPQTYLGSLPNLLKYSFGVNFMIPVDEYQKSERSAKYGFLVISLTFLVFF